MLEGLNTSSKREVETTSKPTNQRRWEAAAFALRVIEWNASLVFVGGVEMHRQGSGKDCSAMKK